jgi:hypothetical protein
MFALGTASSSRGRQTSTCVSVPRPTFFFEASPIGDGRDLLLGGALGRASLLLLPCDCGGGFAIPPKLLATYALLGSALLRFCTKPALATLVKRRHGFGACPDQRGDLLAQRVVGIDCLDPTKKFCGLLSDAFRVVGVGERYIPAQVARDGLKSLDV